MVVACNIASAYALADFQTALPVPAIGVVEAGAMAAAQAHPEGIIGVIGTEGTVASQAYQRAQARLAPRARVVTQTCPLLVPLREEGLVSHPATRLLTEEYLRPLLA